MNADVLHSLSAARQVFSQMMVQKLRAIYCLLFVWYLPCFAASTAKYLLVVFLIVLQYDKL